MTNLTIKDLKELEADQEKLGKKCAERISAEEKKNLTIEYAVLKDKNQAAKK